MCLGLIHAKQISRLLIVDRLDQKEREEYYETPKIHGVSTNDIRFMEADKLVNYTLIVLYCATAVAATYALCTLGLLIGMLNIKQLIGKCTNNSIILIYFIIAQVLLRDVVN